MLVSEDRCVVVAMAMETAASPTLKDGDQDSGVGSLNSGSQNSGSQTVIGVYVPKLDVKVTT